MKPFRFHLNSYSSHKFIFSHQVLYLFDYKTSLKLAQVFIVIFKNIDLRNYKRFLSLFYFYYINNTFNNSLQLSLKLFDISIITYF